MNPFKDTLTWWSKTTTDGHGGYNYASISHPVGRWEDLQENFLDSKGNISLSRAVIYMPDKINGVVTSVPMIGDFLGLGTLSGEPKDNAGNCWPVRQVVKTPDLRRVRTEYRVIL